MPRLSLGDLAPDFWLPTADGSTVMLSNYRGRSVIVYFYPKAMSSGCTTEACDFRDSSAALQAAGYAVLGISPDPVEKLTEFAESEALDFPLASDSDCAVLDAWGAYGEKVKDGVTVTGVIRSTVVVDGEGRVQFAEYDVRPVGHVATLKERLCVA